MRVLEQLHAVFQVSVELNHAGRGPEAQPGLAFVGGYDDDLGAVLTSEQLEQGQHGD
jgi:hypothetical protein